MCLLCLKSQNIPSWQGIDGRWSPAPGPTLYHPNPNPSPNPMCVPVSQCSLSSASSGLCPLPPLPWDLRHAHRPLEQNIFLMSSLTSPCGRCLLKLMHCNNTFIPMGKQKYHCEQWYERFHNKQTARVPLACLGRDLCFNKLLKAEEALWRPVLNALLGFTLTGEHSWTLLQF